MIVVLRLYTQQDEKIHEEVISQNLHDCPVKPAIGEKVVHQGSVYEVDDVSWDFLQNQCVVSAVYEADET
jgi:hypothetical protein